MKQSRQKSTSLQNQRSKYPKCAKVKGHAKEQLSFICLSNNCPNRGLICASCKAGSLHQGHNVQPLKTFLEYLDRSLKDNELNKYFIQEQGKSLKMSNQYTMLDDLQQAHLQALSILKIQIEAIALKIQKCEEEIMKDYQNLRQKIQLEQFFHYGKYQKQKLLNKTVLEIQCYLSDREGQSTTVLDLQLYVTRLIGLIKLVQKNNVQIINQSQNLINGYIFRNNCLKENLLLWERQTNNILNDVFKLKLEYQGNQVNKDSKNRPTTAIQTNAKVTAMTFSPLLKTESIMLTNDNKMAKVKDDKHGKVILLSLKAADVKKNMIKLKITTLSIAGSMQVGLCLKSTVHQKAYKFDKSAPQHGYFVISSNGFIYSSSDSIVNNTKGSFLFKGGDEITVQIDKKDKLLMKKKSDLKVGEISLKHLSQSDWKDLYFCVCMNSKDDKIQLIP